MFQEKSQSIEEWVRSMNAAAWEAGFRAGQAYGIAYERYSEQWDMHPLPEPEANPYRLEKR